MGARAVRTMRDHAGEHAVRTMRENTLTWGLPSTRPGRPVAEGLRYSRRVVRRADPGRSQGGAMAEASAAAGPPVRAVREVLLQRLVEQAERAGSPEDLLHLAKAWEILRAPGGPTPAR